MVASSTSTRASPGESRTPGAASASCGRPGSFHTMATGEGFTMTSSAALRSTTGADASEAEQVHQHVDVVLVCVVEPVEQVDDRGVPGHGWASL